MRTLPPLSVTSTDGTALRRWIDAAETPPALSLRARIVLLSGEGWGPSAIARELSCSKQTAITWRERYRASGVAGLTDGVRSGRPPKMDETVVIRRTLEVPGSGVRWTTRSLGADLGLSNVAVANIWRRWGIKPMARGHVVLTTRPVLDVPVTALVGLHVDPPSHVLAVLTGSSPTPPDRSTATTPPVGSWPAELARTATSGTADPALSADFAHRVVRATGPGAVRPRLLITGDATDVLAAVPGDALLHHVVDDVSSWTRVVHLCCLMAGCHPAGAASVESVQAALSTHRTDCAFSWTSPQCVRTSHDVPPSGP